MPISRDPRMDRRRRFLRDSSEGNPKNAPVARPSRGGSTATDGEWPANSKKNAGYSQDVRRACGQRLVQLIPVRRRSYCAVMLASLLIPACLLTAHYLVYVSGQLPWYGHPLAVAFDASHPRSIAAWFSSHLWLLCLGATVLTFQLRRHKLDDYNGEYRLWFWLVATCMAASIDATTDVSGLLGLALDRWSRLNLGWSGPAVVDATLAVLVGMLGLRLCSELKAVPLSLIFWLVGLICWAGSAALGREELKVELTIQSRIWLGSGLWLGGLTAIWLAALTYLRSIYIEAQQRFLLRGALAGRNPVPLTQRVRASLPSIPRVPTWRRVAEAESLASEADDSSSTSARRGLAGWLKREPTEEPAFRTSGTKRAAAVAASAATTAAATAVSKTAQTSGGPPRRTSAAVSDADDQTASARPRLGRLRSLVRIPKRRTESDGSTEQSKRTSDHKKDAPQQTGSARKWSLARLVPRPKHSDDADEFRKVRDSEPPAESAPRAKGATRTDTLGDKPNAPSRAARLRSRLTTVPRASGTGLLAKLKPKFKIPRLKLPKLKLPAFRLPPPTDTGPQGAGSKIRPVSQSRPLPDTTETDSADSADSSARPLTKAERKRLRRLQQQNRAA